MVRHGQRPPVPECSVPRWLRKLALSAGLSLAAVNAETLCAQELPPAPDETPTATSLYDTFAPPLDPVSIMPNFFGSFVGRSVEASAGIPVTQTLVYTGVGAEGMGSSFVVAPVAVAGPGGPFVLTNNISYTNLGGGNISLTENPELTPQVQGAFAGATFDSGTGTRAAGSVNFAYNYLFATTAQVSLNLPNPSGGGLVGRNQYFDYGSPLVRDRVFFSYDHLGAFESLGRTVDINRYIFGMERVFWDGQMSVELLVPFAGTVNSDQALGTGVATGDAEFGNLGVAWKVVLVRTPNLVVTGGLGISVPTADDTRLLAAGTPILVIENEAWLLQPMFAVAYAPNADWYTQFALQFDFDPTGNPVRGSNGAGGLTHAGTLQDQSYAFLNWAVGRWLTQTATPEGIRGLALQCDLHYDASMGPADSVNVGPITVNDLDDNYQMLSIIPALNYRHNDYVNAGVGVSLPLAGNVSYDWGLTAQINILFGTR